MAHISGQPLPQLEDRNREMVSQHFPNLEHPFLIHSNDKFLEELGSSDKRVSLLDLINSEFQLSKQIPERELLACYRSLVLVFAFLQRQGITLPYIGPDSIYRIKNQIKVPTFSGLRMDLNPAEALLYKSPKLRVADQRRESSPQHDQTKSDVYSVGMLLMHLSLLKLEVPREGTELSVLQQTLNARYSEEWCRLVMKMLTFEESERPDFKKLEEGLSFTDRISVLIPIDKGSIPDISLYFLCKSMSRWGQSVFVKQITCRDPQDYKFAQEEYRFLQSNTHRMILNALDFVDERSTNGKVYIISPRMKGTLKEDIERRCKEGNRHYSEEELWSFRQDLVEMLAYLQKMNISHNNIKPHNIIIDSKGSLKCWNFAKDFRMSGRSPDSTEVLLQYCSPEKRTALIGQTAYDEFKSDVYALGLTMLQLTTLDLAHVRTRDGFNAEEVLNECEQGLQSENILYSQKWYDDLRRMLNDNKDARPDFLDLKEEITYNDDEIVEDTGVEAGTWRSHLRIKAEFGLNYARVNETESEIIPCSIILEALPADNPQEIRNVDLVCVVDESGSMEYERLEIAKKILHNMINSLTERDRMCIIGFSDYADRKCPLIVCSESGKQALREIADQITNRDLTNFFEAFEHALKVVAERKYYHRSARIVMISDGKDTQHEDAKSACLNVLDSRSINNLSVHCIGIGNDTDADLLQAVAEKGKGDHLNIENLESTEQQLRSSYYGLSEVAATDISISITTCLSSKIRCRIESIDPAHDSTNFVFARLFANEKKVIVVILRTELQHCADSLTCSPIAIVLRYNCCQVTEVCKEQPSLAFKRWSDIGPKKGFHVFRHWTRAKAIQCLLQTRKHVHMGSTDCARREIISGIADIESNLICRDSPLVQNYLSLMKRALELVNKWPCNGNIEFSSILAHFLSSKEDVL